MNSLGRIFRISIFGESHGPMVGITIDGCPAGIPVREEDFAPDLYKRKGGEQKATTPRKEEDKPIFLSGIFNDHTTGAPITIVFENNNVRSADYEKNKSIPRPGHADFVAAKKFRGFQDHRGGGHFSGRLTVCLVAAGVVAKKILKNISITSSILEIGGEADVDAGIAKAIAAKDSVGGIIECRVSGCPAGWGEPFFDSVESVLAHAVLSIPAIKGIEFGAGFKAAKMLGSEHNDSMIDAKGTTATNHAGGVVGGITNGNEITFRVVVKPTSSTPKEQQSWNNETGKVEAFSVKGRHDLAIALRVPVVLEAVTAIALADLFMIEKAIAELSTD
jgi:chorismate synthase